jgi:outer membrane protein
MNFLKILTKHFCISIIASLFFVLSLNAQEQKIGVVNFQALVESSPQFRDVMQSLAGEFQPRQREAVAKSKELEELTAKIQKDAAVMGASERANVEKEFRELQREVNRLATELEEDVNLRRNEELGKLQRSILDAVNVYAQSNEYDMVIADGVIYASENVNITGLILESLQDDSQDDVN